MAPAKSRVTGFRVLSLPVFLLSLIPAQALYVNRFEVSRNVEISQVIQKKGAGLQPEFLASNKDELDTLPSGSTCTFDTTNGSVNVVTCENGKWIAAVLHGKSVSVFSHQARVKRDSQPKPIIIEGRSECYRIFSCTPENRPPKITCLRFDAPFYADKLRFDTVVSWSRPTAHDPEQGRLTPYQTRGLHPGSRFREEIHNISYYVLDNRCNHAYCSFSFRVVVPRCSSTYYSYFPNGRVTCLPSNRKNIYGSSCTYSCAEGYQLSGASSVECQQNSTWSARKPSCKVIDCGTPPTITNGTAICWYNNHNYKSRCIIACNTGYALIGANTTTCQANQQWTTPGVCQDICSPIIECKPLIEVYAGPKRQAVPVTWSTPKFKDCSGGSATLTSSLSSGSLFSPGVSLVTFVARDTAGNSHSCSTVVYVKVKTCQILNPPANSQVTCTDNYDYGSECEITCDVTHQLVGISKRRCQEDMTWSGQNPQCEVRSCPEPPRISNGYYNCSNGREYQKTCSLICDEGFRLTAPYTITCKRSIEWSSPGSCFDVEPPEFPDGCPDVNITAASLRHATIVTYSLPNTTDNSGDDVRVTSSHPSGTSFNTGMTTVTITAQDSNLNTDSCQFVVNVKNSSCGEPHLDLSGLDLMEYNCPNGYVHGAMCDITCPDLNRTKGASTIRCDNRGMPGILEWIYPGNERPYCNSSTCPKLPDPVHGSWGCRKNGNGETCALICEKKYTFPASAKELITCFNGRWLSRPGKCTRRQRDPNALNGVFDFYYLTQACATNITEVKEKFLKNLANSNSTYACMGNAQCTLDSVTVTCGSSSFGRRRKKRSATQLYEYEISVTISLGTVQIQDTPSETQLFYDRLMASINAQFEEQANQGLLNVPEIGTYDGSGYRDPVYTCDPGMIFIYRTQSCAACGKGFKYVDDTCVPCPRGSYQDRELAYNCTLCPSGQTTRNLHSTSIDECEDFCHPGEFSSTGLKPCELCPQGTYQSNLGMSKCDICPYGMSTESDGATSLDSCHFFNIRMSDNHIGPSIGLYESYPKTFSIVTWIGDVSTSRKTAMNFNVGLGCGDAEAASIFLDDISLCITVQRSRKIRKWYHLALVFENGTATFYLDGQVTRTVSGLQAVELYKKTFSFQGSTEIKSVLVSGFQMTRSVLTQKEVSEFSRTCEKRLSRNVLTVEEIDETLVSPSTCDDTDNCANVPCGQFATCIDGKGQHTCICDDLTSSFPCQGIDYCDGNECDNGATCFNQPDSKNYTCACPPGFKGELCDAVMSHGIWSKWSEWSVCSPNCGPGQQIRVRECVKPDAESQNCDGNEEETRPCERRPCPVDCSWRDWTSWICDSTCGNGTATRTRQIAVEAANGGDECQGQSEMYKPCQNPDCPVDGQFGDWSAWSECSVSCGGGERSRTRECNSPAASNGGKACEGEAREIVSCNEEQCAECKDPEMRPGHKSFECTYNETSDIKTCKIICEPFLVYSPGVENSFQCGAATNYTWSHQTEENPTGILPACLEQKALQSFTAVLIYTYSGVSCYSAPSLSTFTSTIGRQMNILSCLRNGTCDFDAVANSTCTNGVTTTGDVTISINLKTTTTRSQTSTYTSVTEKRNELYVVEGMATEILYNSREIFTTSVSGVTYVAKFKTALAEVNCEAGAGFYNGTCVDCPPGSFFNGGQSCQLCKKGFYQNQARMTSCSPCPEGTSTSGEGSFSISQCVRRPKTIEDYLPLFVSG